MKSYLLAIVPVSLFVVAGCSSTAESMGPSTSGSDELAAACPTPGQSDDVMRAAATVAYRIMKHSASVTATMPLNKNIKVSTAALAAVRYKVQASGTGIEWDSTDPLYQYVNDDMKADLAEAQTDPAVAKFLSDGLVYDKQTTDGLWYPSIRAIAALGSFVSPGPNTTTIPDSTASSHTVTVAGQPWCNTELVTIDEVVVNSWGFSPLYKDQVQQWRTTAPGFNSSRSTSVNTPFNGNQASGNPYLMVMINGVTTSWASYNFSPVSCYSFPNATCKSEIQIDPMPYADPAAYSNAAGLVGTQANPFDLNSAVLYADPAHAYQWATRTVNGVQEWGQFDTPKTFFGKIVYYYTKKISGTLPAPDAGM